MHEDEDRPLMEQHQLLLAVKFIWLQGSEFAIFAFVVFSGVNYDRWPYLAYIAVGLFITWSSMCGWYLNQKSYRPNSTRWTPPCYLWWLRGWIGLWLELIASVEQYLQRPL